MSPAEKESAEALEDYQVNIMFALSREQLISDIRSNTRMETSHLSEFLGKFGLLLSSGVHLQDGVDPSMGAAETVRTQLLFIDVHSSPTYVEADPNSTTVPPTADIQEEIERLSSTGLTLSQAATHYVGARLMERYTLEETNVDLSAEMAAFELGVAFGG